MAKKVANAEAVCPEPAEIPNLEMEKAAIAQVRANNATKKELCERGPEYLESFRQLLQEVPEKQYEVFCVLSLPVAYTPPCLIFYSFFLLFAFLLSII